MVLFWQDHEKGLKDAEKEQMSSLVWISHSSGSHTQVSVIDANSPGDILETFKVSSSPILCIASVAGEYSTHHNKCIEFIKAVLLNLYFTYRYIHCIASVAGKHNS